MLLTFNAYTESEKHQIEEIRNYNWPKLLKFWSQIKIGNTPGWQKGKALEYMFVRAFDLGGAHVAYPYINEVNNRAKEQFDGYVFIPELGAGFLIECKDWNENASFDELAKLHGRLNYRMPASELIYMMHPQNILLWSFAEIEECFKHHKFVAALMFKYQYAKMTANPNIAVLDGFNI